MGRWFAAAATPVRPIVAAAARAPVRHVAARRTVAAVRAVRARRAARRRQLAVVRRGRPNRDRRESGIGNRELTNPGTLAKASRGLFFPVSCAEPLVFSRGPRAWHRGGGRASNECAGFQSSVFSDQSQVGTVVRRQATGLTPRLSTGALPTENSQPTADDSKLIDWPCPIEMSSRQAASNQAASRLRQYGR